jgi:alpha-L-rhamnosidase
LCCALFWGLLEPERRARVLQNLTANVQQQNGHIDTGILGAKYLLNTLTDNGRSDVAYQVASQTDLPGWGWWIEQGATTLWESWNGGDSHDHIMFGDISAWFYKALAGINPDPALPGFKHFIIGPQPVGDLRFARAEYDSIHGKIVSDWKIKKGRFDLHVVIPPNTTATVYIPNSRLYDVREGWMPAVKSEGVTSFSQEGTAAVFEVESGEYHFAAPL